MEIFLNRVAGFRVIYDGSKNIPLQSSYELALGLHLSPIELTFFFSYANLLNKGVQGKGPKFIWQERVRWHWH